jgi:hypothetical protein
MTEHADELHGEPDAEAVEFEIPAVTAPTMPVEHTLTNSHTFYQRTVGGGMQVKFLPIVMTPSGAVPAPEAYVIVFNPDGWERFKREVAADGVKPPTIETARHFPGGLLNGDGQR